MTQADWITAVRARLRDPSGQRFSDPNIVTAVGSEARSLATTNLPREILLGWSNKSSELTIGSSGEISLSGYLRIVGGTVNGFPITGIDSPEENRDINDPATVPTVGSPRIDIRNKKIFILPITELSGKKCFIDYIVDPPNSDDTDWITHIPNILYDIVSTGAAARLAADSQEFDLYGKLMERKTIELKQVVK